MIETENLSKRFEDFLAVDGVNLRIEAGEVLALLGPNGAGKTTTVRMLTSVLRPSSGWARVAGFDVVRQAEKVRAVVGVLTEQHGLYGRMPADDYLDFFGKLYGMEAGLRRRRINELLEQFGLDPDRRRKIGEYSKGMRQKLALARALLHDPPVLLLDEPTSAMDPESARLVRDAIHGLRSANRTIIICTHNLPEAEELADQIAIIRRGSIIERGTPDELKQRLLGAEEYEVRLSASLGESELCLPQGARMTARGEDWFRFQSDAPRQQIPLVVQCLVEHRLPVLELYEVPRSLERVYLQAVNAPANGSNGGTVLVQEGQGIDAR
jgi:ABC-2 type transport system ATP-binding protein